MSLANIVLCPLQRDGGQVREHFVCFDSGEGAFYQLVTFALLPFSDIGRLLDVLPVDAVEPEVLDVVIDVDAFCFGFPHVFLSLNC